MHRKMIGRVISFVIILNCLVWSTNAVYATGPIDDMIAKRKYQRRSFLKSFCARRCNIGKGGNVCRCNGFHFAGKRNSNSFLDDDITGNSEEMIYKVLADTDKIRLNPRFEDENTANADTRLKKEIDYLLPSVMRESFVERPYQQDQVLTKLLKLYMTPDDSTTM